MNFTWERCIEYYRHGIDDLEESGLSIDSLFPHHLMIKVVEQLRDDPEIPELGRLVSHLELQLWYYPTSDFSYPLINIVADEEDTVLISGAFAQVKVPLRYVSRTVKLFLKRLESLQNIQTGVNEIGEIEDELRALPLEMIYPRTLVELWRISTRYKANKIKVETLSEMPADNMRLLIKDMMKIEKLITQALDIDLEKRSQSWLKELEQDEE